MTQENKLIRKFVNDNDIYAAINFVYDGELLDYDDLNEQIEDELHDIPAYEFEITKINYDTDWNLLMNVVERINSIAVGGGVLYSLRDALLTGEITKVYKEVVNFIKWYNEWGVKTQIEINNI